jgi:hypothetical protein
MAIPIRHAPTLTGAAARRFERLRKQAEKEAGTIDITEDKRVFLQMVERAKEHGYPHLFGY